jgi:hypothetical protein
VASRRSGASFPVRARAKAAAPVSENGGLGVMMTQNAWSSWLTGRGPDSGMTVIRSVANQNLVWNASGAGPWNPGNPVLAYPWQGGAQNEQWVMTYVRHFVT